MARSPVSSTFRQARETCLGKLTTLRFSVTGALLAWGGKRPYTDGPAGPFVYRLGREIFNLERRVRLP
jgi:hypothetical protein